MPILDRKTVTFHSTAIEGVDTIKYVDILWQDTCQPFNETWEVYTFEAYVKGIEITDRLSDITVDRLWFLVNQHSEEQHADG